MLSEWFIVSGLKFSFDEQNDRREIIINFKLVWPTPCITDCRSQAKQFLLNCKVLVGLQHSR